ncbi:MAG: hypothetical protein V1773_09820 [bacterium]
MKNEKETAKNQLLFAVLDYIEKEGNNIFTAGNVTAVTKVNIDNINYLFGSKEKLLEEAFEIYLYNNLRLFEIY